MNLNTKSKWQVRLAAVLIFVIGFAGGALAFNAYQKWSRSNGRGERPARFEAMLDRLQLSNDQRTQVKQILDETRQQLDGLRKESEPRFNSIRQQADERLQKVLSPEQWTQFQQERDSMRSRGRRGRGR
ncbi:MAG TPA: periplasmic heavy metal sensor [Pyrinomonadaceae bacterium]